MTLPRVECVICEELFTPERSWQRLCSDKCRREHKRQKGAGRRESVNERGAMGFREIGDAIGVSHGTVQNDLRSALEKMRAVIRKEDFR